MFRIDISSIEKIQELIKNFPFNAEEAINSVLHNEGAQLIQDDIRRLMPESKASWKGKKPPAKSSESMRNSNGNLSVTVRSAKAYQYLYFPDDGSNTRRHAGNQQFFLRGAEAASDDIIERCVTKMMNNFEEI